MNRVKVSSKQFQQAALRKIRYITTLIERGWTNVNYEGMIAFNISS